MARTVHYYRVQPKEDNELVVSTGKLAGRPPRNIFQSSFPKVKAFIGKLGDQTGIEFITMVQPDEGCPPPARRTGRRDTRVLEVLESGELVAVAVTIVARND